MTLSIIEIATACKTNPDKRRRLEVSIDETLVLLDKANRYSPEFRDLPYIAELEAHRSKLVAALGLVA